MPELLEDRERLDAFRRGDGEVLTRLFELHALDVAASLQRGFAFHSDGRPLRFRGVHEIFDLDDLVQEVFIRAFGETARTNYDGLQPFRTYVLGIARNVVIDRYRRATRWASLFTSATSTECRDATAEAPSPTPGPEAAAIDAQLRAIFATFAQGLDPVDREVLRLRFAENKTRREVTEATGLTAMQVRTREEKLREALRQRLRAGGYAEEVGEAAVTAALLILGVLAHVHARLPLGA